MNVAFPLRTDGHGRIASTEEDDHIRDLHIRDLMEQVLFTIPGERVNRPTFGTGLLQLVFAPNSDEIAATLQFVVESALTQWLGDLIELRGVSVESRDAILQVTVAYVIRRTQESRIAEFSRGVAS
jgi:phage baseplate assembly protein W